MPIRQILKLVTPSTIRTRPQPEQRQAGPADAPQLWQPPTKPLSLVFVAGPPRSGTTWLNREICDRAGAYLLCDEASTSAVHRAALQGGSAHDTILTNVFTGRTARGIVNRLMRELGPISPLAPAFPLASTAIAPLRSHAEEQGSGDFSPLWAGQNVSGCRAISAAAMTRQLAP